MAAPIVNVFGFTSGDRYPPDRRDLNRSFPGSAEGRWRAAHRAPRHDWVVGRGEVGIDLHTGSFGRTNHPQIRADLDDPRTRDLAEAFAAPVMINARLRDGSLRAAARERGAAVLLYEAGEAWRFDAWAIEAGGRRRAPGARGPGHGRAGRRTRPPRASSPDPAAGSGQAHRDPPGSTRSWVSGSRSATGSGSLSDSFGKTLRLVHADRSGIVIGRTTTPLVNRGDALIHIAGLEPNGTGAEAGGAKEEVEEQVERFPRDLEPDLS